MFSNKKLNLSCIKYLDFIFIKLFLKVNVEFFCKIWSVVRF